MRCLILVVLAVVASTLSLLAQGVKPDPQRAVEDVLELRKI
jgi:hypothetical protein